MPKFDKTFTYKEVDTRSFRIADYNDSTVIVQITLPWKPESKTVGTHLNLEQAAELRDLLNDHIKTSTRPVKKIVDEPYTEIV